MPDVDAVVVGAGPNGLAAAIELARNGCSVVVVEANESIGGGARSGELTLPGFVHDICSTAYPMVAGSPFLSKLPLHEHGLEWVAPEITMAHPFDDGTAALMYQNIDETAAGLGRDGRAWRSLLKPFVRRSEDLARNLLSPMRVPRSPFLLARFGLSAIRSTTGLVNSRFRGDPAKALFGGIAAHSVLKLDQPASAAFGMMLGIYGHVHNWPFVRGGSQNLTDAMASYLRSLGGRIEVGQRIHALSELPSSRVTLLNLTPRQILALAGHKMNFIRRWQLRRYRYGPGVFKLDWALSDPIPWKNPDVRRAGTVHVAGEYRELAISEDLANRGLHAERPFVLMTQPSLFDDRRAPAGKHTAWGYCHVPHGSTIDMTERIEQQIERFAPGFKETILARATRSPVDLEIENANNIGGDINGGVQDLGQLFTRPVPRFSPYRTPVPGLYICSSSTPPGGGVHGMSGYYAARAALADM